MLKDKHSCFQNKFNITITHKNGDNSLLKNK